MLGGSQNWGTKLKFLAPCGDGTGGTAGPIPPAMDGVESKQKLGEGYEAPFKGPAFNCPSVAPSLGFF